MPRLPLGHFLGAAVVVADVRHAIEDFLAIQLQHDPEGAVRRGVVGPQIQEHVISVGRATGHAPFLGHEAQRFLLEVLFGVVQAEGVEFGGARRVILAQRMALPGAGHQEPHQVGVTLELDTEKIPDLAFVPVGVGPDTGDGRQLQVVGSERDLDAHIAVSLDRQEVIKDGEIGRRHARAMAAQPLVDAVQIEEHRIGFGCLPQVLEHGGSVLSRHPDGGNCPQRVLKMDSGPAEALVQLRDDRVLAAR